MMVSMSRARAQSIRPSVAEPVTAQLYLGRPCADVPGVLRAFHPDLAVLPLGVLGRAYFGLLATCTATCVVVGYYGGKLVFH